MLEQARRSGRQHPQSVLIQEEPPKFMNINSDSFKKLPFHERAQHIAKAKDARL